MMKYSEKQAKRSKAGGFTMVEIIVVVVILGIAAMMAVPMLSSAADMQARAAADRIASDLDYAKGLAVTHQTPYTVVFSPSGDSYDIRVTSTDTLVSNPVRPSENYLVDFSTDSRLNRVDITDADFDSDADNAITFDYLGSPHSGKLANSPLTSGDTARITLVAEDFTLYVDVEPITGYVTITSP
jgi:prepilin-type N-terminal cleavage/methylation domain-containing protein